MFVWVVPLPPPVWMVPLSPPVWMVSLSPLSLSPLVWMVSLSPLVWMVALMGDVLALPGHFILRLYYANRWESFLRDETPLSLA